MQGRYRDVKAEELHRGGASARRSVASETAPGVLDDDWHGLRFPALRPDQRL